MSAELVSARLEWEHAYRDLEHVSRNPVDAERVERQLAAVSAELRRRIGGTYTLRELADEYVAADRWARDVLADQAVPGWPRTVALVGGAAFHLYSRGAVDWVP
jgi:alcohol dehydrogenase class IV